jgi:hypothetical protein
MLDVHRSLLASCAETRSRWHDLNPSLKFVLSNHFAGSPGHAHADRLGLFRQRRSGIGLFAATRRAVRHGRHRNPVRVLIGKVRSTRSTLRRSGQNSLSVCVYYASAPLQAGKTVTRIVLPNVSTSVVSGQPSLHVFAATIR